MKSLLATSHGRSLAKSVNIDLQDPRYEALATLFDVHESSVSKISNRKYVSPMNRPMREYFPNLYIAKRG